MNVRIISLCLFAFFATPISAQTDGIVYVDGEDEAMNQAMETARETIGTFLTVMNAPEEGMTDFAIKVAIADDAGTEHFWLKDITLSDQSFEGTVSNEPARVKKVQFGERYKFQRNEISDWMYMQDGKIYGGYTIRVLLKDMAPEQAREFESMLAD